MGQFFAGDYPGPAFELFGPAHLAALLAIVLLNLFLLRFKGADERTLTRVRWTMAIFLWVNEFAWHIWNYSVGKWTIQTMLPLHLCSVFVYLSAYMLITRSEKVYEYAYFLGIAGALQAVLTPDAGQYGFPHFRYFQTMISHGLLFSIPIYFTVVEGFRPTLRSIKRVLVGANLYMLFVGLVNWAIGSNYLFIAHKPETASLLDVLPAWPWYILYIEGIGILMIAILYLPFFIKDQAARKSVPAA